VVEILLNKFIACQSLSYPVPESLDEVKSHFQQEIICMFTGGVESQVENNIFLSKDLGIVLLNLCLPLSRRIFPVVSCYNLIMCYA
jgi:hypothetical protein